MSRRSLPAILLAAAVAGGACSASAAPRRAVSAMPAPDAQEQRFATDYNAFLRAALVRLPSVPAVSIAVTRSDHPIYLRAFGMADIEQRVPATTHTRFYIASSTKSYLGLAFALLERRGVISLDWTLA